MVSLKKGLFFLFVISWSIFPTTMPHGYTLEFHIEYWQHVDAGYSPKFENGSVIGNTIYYYGDLTLKARECLDHQYQDEDGEIGDYNIMNNGVGFVVDWFDRVKLTLYMRGDAKNLSLLFISFEDAVLNVAIGFQKPLAFNWTLDNQTIEPLFYEPETIPQYQAKIGVGADPSLNTAGWHNLTLSHEGTGSWMLLQFFLKEPITDQPMDCYEEGEYNPYDPWICGGTGLQNPPVTWDALIFMLSGILLGLLLGILIRRKKLHMQHEGSDS